jgi:hypothetical protein
VGRLLTIITAVLAACVAADARAGGSDVDLSVDLRLVASSTDQLSYLNGGGGKLRFDSQHDGLRVGSLRLGYRSDISDTLRLTAEAYAYGDPHDKAIDLTELHLTWRPIPIAAHRQELKAGAFYAPISLENRLRGWRSPYTLTPSAINSWVGEELRTIGFEYDYDWLGQQQGHAWNLGFTGAVYGYNDPAGVMMGLRGWALHDRQTSLFETLGRPDGGIYGTRRLIYPDIDHRPGYYAGGSANYRGVLELRALHYDNRGEPEYRAPQINDGAWKTEFESLGLRYTPDDAWTVMWQRLTGFTAAGEQVPPNDWRFDSDYWLVSWLHGAHRLSARLDRFAMHQDVTYFGFYNFDAGRATTLAWCYEFSPRVSLIVEGLQLKSELGSRLWIGAPVAATERQLQLALRLDL